MGKRKQNQAISIIKPEDRAGDGNLLPETRQKALETIKKIIKHSGHVNISALAAQLGLSRQTTKKLVGEVMAELKEDIIDQSIAFRAWLESVVEDIDSQPGLYGEPIEEISLKMKMLKQINSIDKQSEKSININQLLILLACLRDKTNLVKELEKK